MTSKPATASAAFKPLNINQRRNWVDDLAMKLSLAELIISEARERGLRHFFGIPGGGSPLDMLDAGRRFGVDFVNINHESSAAIAAAYYGLMKNTAGLVLAIKGVGISNLVGGIADAYFERLPLVAVCE